MLEREYVVEALDLMKRKDPSKKIFGASAHNYQLNPPASSSSVREVEGRFGCTFPSDYRSFITEIGNGGAGPSYGLFRFGEHDDGHGFIDFPQGYLTGDLAAHFPHKTAWNLPPEFWAQEPDEESMSEVEFDEAYEKWDLRVSNEYWGDSIMDGAIPICHLGCAYREWLVITGDERGSVWRDERADDKGIAPLAALDGSRVSFSLWYQNWIDECLAQDL